MDHLRNVSALMLDTGNSTAQIVWIALHHIRGVSVCLDPAVNTFLDTLYM